MSNRSLKEIVVDGRQLMESYPVGVFRHTPKYSSKLEAKQALLNAFVQIGDIISNHDLYEDINNEELRDIAMFLGEKYVIQKEE